MRGNRGRNTVEDAVIAHIDGQRRRDKAREFNQLFTGRPYDLRRWRRLRLEQLHRESCCRMCAELGITKAAAAADHITPMSQGGAFDDPANLQSLCWECHSRKTRSEQTGKPVQAAVKGVDATTGLPIDGAHWWRL